MRQPAIVENIKNSLQIHSHSDYQDKKNGQKGESRILDLWADMPQPNPVLHNVFFQLQAKDGETGLPGTDQHLK